VAGAPPRPGGAGGGSHGPDYRAATSEKFREGKVTFGNGYDVIDMESTMMRLFLL